MIKFFYMNRFILLSQILLVFSIFSYKITLSPVLLNYYNFTETLLNYSNIIFSIRWFIGILFINKLSTYKFNSIKVLRYLLLVIFIFSCSELLIIHFSLQYHFLQYIYLINRFFEGFFNQILFSLIGNLLTYKLVYNKKNGSINGILNSISMFIKFAAPTIGSLFIFSFFPLMNMFFIIFISISLFFIFNLYEKNLLREYHRYLIKKITKDKEKFKKINKNFVINSFNIKKIYNRFFEHKDVKKNYFLATILLNSSVRNFYDLYFILFLTQYYKFSITERTFIFSFSILGFSMQFITGYLADKFNYIKLQYYSYFVTVAIFVLLYCYELNSFYLIIVRFILGVKRSIHSNWEYKMSVNEYKNFKVFIEESRNFLKLNIEIGNISGYLVRSIIFYYFSFDGLLLLYMFIYILLILLETFIKRYKLDFVYVPLNK